MYTHAYIYVYTYVSMRQADINQFSLCNRIEKSMKRNKDQNDEHIDPTTTTEKHTHTHKEVDRRFKFYAACV